MKIYLTTTAYENAIDVGIASPNVLHLGEQKGDSRMQGSHFGQRDALRPCHD